MQTSNISTPRWANRKSVAKYLNCSVMTVRRLEKDSRFPKGSRRGNKLIIHDLNKVDEFMRLLADDAE